MADFEPSIKTPRRMYLLKAHEANRQGDVALMLVWCAKQEAQPGTALPSGFPTKTELEAANYLAEEDLTGANLEELEINAGLTATQAEAVFAALAEL